MSEDPSGRPPGAVERYKEITATATDAVERMHELERKRAEQLEDEVVAGRERIAEAEQQEERVAEGVRSRWNAAMEALWDERWMRVTSIPAPDPSAPAATPEESLRSVQDASLELHEALGKPRWSVTSLLPKPRSRRDER
ncbi:hypothetical protein DFQ14_106128 [Halopolyspora algeriensis]|uniref:Uncharacterized protein n=1 Tax=Halopolyspora algeriensis TaxID=1500506 RepID=A0A368VQ28_9ACTN|nr:hypothetical protein [Halopolyspora algeriensis]RCW43650.1 hypothetical protein DFQ14_106128 [Halopolyspora algeriensis]TQM47567.1 hypothetical protein FHU43_3561 [Halopolyspora algeriensis]